MAFALTLASLSLILAVIWGQPLIRLLRLWRMGTSIREELPGKYQEKMGTPTMGGLMVIIPVLLLTIALNIANLVNPAPIPTGGTQAVIGRSILVPMGVMVGFAVLGGIDDYVSVRGTRRGEGISGCWLLLAQVTIALATGAVLYFWLGYHNAALPGVSQPVNTGAFYMPIAAFIIVCTTNAVNLTDGMDGLAGVLVASAFAAYAVIAFLQGWTYLARFGFIVVGAAFAVLWYNAHPAELFMGGLGSYSLGATLAVIALMSGQWLVLPIVALVPVAEILSVILQVGYFKLTRRRTGQPKRLFKMSPLHYHFQLSGWSETSSAALLAGGHPRRYGGRGPGIVMIGVMVNVKTETRNATRR